MSQAADIIIIGGGAAGCSAAMQLSLRGRRVLVLERALLGSGSTGRAAGLGAQLRESPDETRLLMKGIEVVKDIDKQPFIDAMKPVYEKYVTNDKLKDLVARIQATE